MTSRLSKSSTKAGKLETFPEFPPRDDMQNALHLYDDGHQAILRRHYGITDSMIILSEMPVRWSPLQRQGHRIPDFLIAFDVDRPLAVTQNGYSIREQGKPPDFVLEVASLTTRNRDLIEKRHDYANFGVPEYWRFDPTGGRLYGDSIAGDRLADGTYASIEILEVAPEHLHGQSTVLGLDLCWDHGKLRWFDPSTGGHLMTFYEESDARIADQDALVAEREARIVAEARVRELEEQLRDREPG